MSQSKDDIGVVSIGTFAEGINVKNINYVILATPLKSKVKILQLIGRGLRLDDDKNSVIYIDICDDLSIGKYKNFSLLHAHSRYQRFKDEQFDISFHTYHI